jgi:hypothetical protein
LSAEKQYPIVDKADNPSCSTIGVYPLRPQRFLFFLPPPVRAVFEMNFVRLEPIFPVSLYITLPVVKFPAFVKPEN